MVFPGTIGSEMVFDNWNKLFDTSRLAMSFPGGCQIFTDMDKFATHNKCGASTDPADFATLPALLRWRAQKCEEQAFYTYLVDGETQTVGMTCRELERKALAIGAKLQSLGKPGDRVLLLCPPGIDFVSAFYGAICAGMIAAPAYPPHNNQTLARLEAMVEDAEASFVLATSSVLDQMEQRSSLDSRLAGVGRLAIEDIPAGLADAWVEPALESDSLALLQYTSGSTGKPKGAMVSHGNLLHNASLIRDCFGLSSESRGVIWLPPYHDMGLMGGIVCPLYLGSPVVLMSPFHFLQKPLRWLDAVTRYRATISGGPNFAYDLCVDKISPEERSGLDLSCWDAAFNGAEPVRAETIDRFATVFASRGFERKSFLPCYGLAEATLLVSGRIGKVEPMELHVDSQALQTGLPFSVPGEKGKGRVLVGCGGAGAGQRLLIVDPENRIQREAGEIGEIWVKGSSVAQGYWNRPEETRMRFHATLADTGEGPFLRTGDLGFLHNDELFVTGRLKDLIIVRGCNHYPHDIELTVERSHGALRAGCGAAFSVDVDGGERLVVVQEVDREFSRDGDPDEVFSAIREAVSEEHELQVHTVVLIRMFSIFKTSSGKVQRHLCRAAFLDGTLRVVRQSVGLPGTVRGVLPFSDPCVSWPEKIEGQNPERLQSLLESHLLEKAARIARVSPGGIDPRKPLKALGIDSLMAVELKLAIEMDTGAEIPIEAIFAGASISDLASDILRQLAGGAEAGAGIFSPLSGKPARRAERSSGDACPRDSQCETPPEHFHLEDFPELRNFRRIIQGMETFSVANPYFKEYQGINRNTGRVGGREVITFSSYNYLGLSGHPLVSRAAKDAIDLYGTSVSASRLASGERPLHRDLEKELAGLVGAEDCIAYVSGHATNVTTIGHLFGKDDLILHDALIHNSVLEGCALSGAAHRSFPHNDWQALDKVLDETRSSCRRVLVVIEGLYSMDGDIPELPAFIEIKKRHKALLMVDEAHSIGVLGKHGRGIGDHFSVNPADVDLWMGTLSKSFASCGGYVAGCKALIEYLKYTAPGFVYSVGMTPANTAAALTAVGLLNAEPERVTRLRSLAKYFWDMAREKGLDTGSSSGAPIVPVIVGHSLKAMKLSQALFNKGIDVLPMVYPAVPDRAARLRFFINSTHTIEQIRYTLETTTGELENSDAAFDGRTRLKSA